MKSSIMGRIGILYSVIRGWVYYIFSMMGSEGLFIYIVWWEGWVYYIYGVMGGRVCYIFSVMGGRVCYIYFLGFLFLLFCNFNFFLGLSYGVGFGRFRYGK